MKKNAAANIPFALINASSGAAMTGATLTAVRCLDNGAQAAATGTFSEKGNGQYNFAASAADMNGAVVGLLFTATGAIPVHFTISTVQEFLDKLLMADLKIDTATTPWAMVWYERGTATELLRKDILDTAGVDITSTAVVPGRFEQ